MLSKFCFDPLQFRNDHEGFRKNAEIAHRLTTSLLDRGGIPDARLRHFSQPEYFPGGRGASRQDMFTRNGNSHEETLRHPHFLKHLRFFIHGAALPSSIIEAFSEAVQDCGMVTSGDLASLGASARKLARSHRLEGGAAADEFFKLSLDLGLSAGQAASIRASVKQLRPVR